MEAYDRLDGYEEVAEQTEHDVRDASVLTFEEIGNLAAESGNATETLTNIVALIAKRFQTDVCSVYLLEPDRANLVLAATIGLRPESVGRVRMRLSEGLAGLVAEQLRPQCVGRCDDASALQVLPGSGRGSVSARFSACRSSIAGCCRACSSSRRSNRASSARTTSAC